MNIRFNLLLGVHYINLVVYWLLFIQCNFAGLPNRERIY